MQTKLFQQRKKMKKTSDKGNKIKRKRSTKKSKAKKNSNDILKNKSRKKHGKSLKNKPEKKKSGGKHGKGIINTAINHLPIEMHMPGYQFCGPGDNKVSFNKNIFLY